MYIVRVRWLENEGQRRWSNENKWSDGERRQPDISLSRALSQRANALLVLL